MLALDVLSIALDDGLSRIPETSEPNKTWKTKFAVAVKLALQSTAQGGDVAPRPPTPPPAYRPAADEVAKTNTRVAKTDATLGGPALGTLPKDATKGPRRKGRKDPTPVTRVLIRSPPITDGELKGVADIKAVACSTLGLGWTNIQSVRRVKRGLIVASTLGEEFTSKALARSTPKAPVELVVQTVGYHIIGVPRIVRTPSGPRPVEEFLLMEVQAVTKVKLELIVLTKSGHWIVNMPEEVRPFRLFGSQLARKMVDRVKVHQCENCFGYYRTSECYGRERYKDCGRHFDVKPHCCSRPRYPGYHGPWKPGHTTCQARPKVVDGKVLKPTLGMLKAVRLIGHKESQQANAKKDKEENTTADKTGSKGVEAGSMELDSEPVDLAPLVGPELPKSPGPPETGQETGEVHPPRGMETYKPEKACDLELGGYEISAPPKSKGSLFSLFPVEKEGGEVEEEMVVVILKVLRETTPTLVTRVIGIGRVSKMRRISSIPARPIRL